MAHPDAPKSLLNPLIGKSVALYFQKPAVPLLSA